MYDICDVLNASYCSADVANHVLREYGEGSMGRGIRKLAGEMLTIGGRASYDLGYKKGVVTTSIIGVAAVGLIGFGAWCTKKIMEYRNTKKELLQSISECLEEVTEDVQE